MGILAGITLIVLGISIFVGLSRIFQLALDRWRRHRSGLVDSERGVHQVTSWDGVPVNTIVLEVIRVFRKRDMTCFILYEPDGRYGALASSLPGDPEKYIDSIIGFLQATKRADKSKKHLELFEKDA